MHNADKIKSLLMDDIHWLAQHPALFAKNPEKDFTRRRGLLPEEVLLFPIQMQRDSLAGELLTFYEYRTDAPSPSAYIQQRAKLLPDAMRSLLLAFNGHFSPALFKNKYSVIAIDGSSFSIFRNPSDPDTYSPPSGQSPQGYNQIHVVASYQPASRTFIDAVIHPLMKKNEYAALCQLIDRCRTDQGIPVFLADRGFPSLNAFAHAQEKGVFFLFRAKKDFACRLLGADMPAGGGEFDVPISRTVVRTKAKKHWSRPDMPELYRYVDKNTSFDYISPGSPGEYHIHLRVVRVQIPGGEVEYLVTNLPSHEFGTGELCFLYSLRWGIETSFRELKHAVGASDFHSKALENVTHEVWARLILYNFCSRITALAAIKKRDTKHIYQVNYTMAIKNCHDFLRRRRISPPIDIEGLIGKYLLPVRPGRNYARQHRFRIPMKFVYRH